MKKKPFTPSTIEKVRIAAGFKCCICRANPCFHTHHLDPAAGNGFDNAAPLCELCHSRYGNDPYKQKFIRQARDDWYNHNEETCSIRKKEFELNREILEKLEKLERKTATKDEILEDLVPKVVETLSSIEVDMTNYAKKGDHWKYIQSLSSLGSTATYTSGQISTIKYGVDDEKLVKESLPSIEYPVLIDIMPHRCTICGRAVYGPSFSFGGECPYCGGLLE